MCGIAAVTGRECEADADSLRHALRHRGPDWNSQIDLPGCSLGAARLAVLDTSPRGAQPMSFEGRHLVYNGELYNFRSLRAQLEDEGMAFESTGDTEVVLKALVRWGSDAIRRFHGMYAFVLWDERRRELWAARDRLGIKPLYWSRRDGGIAVASESTPLAQLSSPAVNATAVDEFLRFGSPVTTTIHEAVHELHPGVLTTWRSDGSRVGCPWQSPGPERDGDLDGLFRAVVREQLTSDRPLSIFLGGGFDSAAIAACASDDAAPLCITVAHAGNAADVDRARATTARYGLEHHIHDLRGADATRLVMEWIRAMDQPSIDGLNTHIVSSVSLELGRPIALSGIGGDELFGGYGYYRRIGQVERLAPLWRRTPGRGSIAAALDRTMPRSRATRIAAILDASSTVRRHAAWRSVFDEQEVERLTGRPFELSDRWLVNPAEPRSTQLSRLDRGTYLEPTLLRDADVFSMARGVEARVPFLDDRFVDAVDERAPITKQSFAEMFADDHLMSVASAKKLTFSLPWRDWLARAAREIAPTQASWRDVVDGALAVDLFRESVVGGSDPARGMALLVLAGWLDRQDTDSASLSGAQ